VKPLRSLRELNEQAPAAPAVSPGVELPGNADERTRVDQEHASQVQPNDSGAVLNEVNEVRYPLGGAIGENTRDVERGTPAMRFERDATELHASIQ
jgi:hypothetical protein